jgi:heavy metal sensor kinase
MINRLRTVRVRLTLWYVLLLGVTLFGFSLYLFLELRQNLLNQIDSSLQTASVQALSKLDEETQTRFVTQVDTDLLTAGLRQSGVSLRLITTSGAILDGYGGYQALPTWAAQVPGYVTLIEDAAIWRLYSYPLQLRGEAVTLWLQAAQPLDGVYDTLDGLLALMLFGLPVILVVATAGGVFLADRSLRPVDRMTRTASAVTANRLDQRISHLGPPDELGRLAHTLDTMLDRLQTAFETERRFTADASHELRTPLTVVKGHIDVALSRPRSPEEYTATLETIRAENERLIRLVNSLLYLAKLDTAPLQAETETVDLAELLTLVGDQMYILAEKKPITLTCQIPPLPPISGNRDHLIRLFLNLLENAIKYTPAGGTVTLTADHRDGVIHVCIRDTGSGIAPEHLPHLFERFYRVKDGTTHGTGLGLAIAHSIAREHRGDITVTSEVGRGSIFTVTLPVHRMHD